MKNKKLYIIPGYREPITDKGYQRLIKSGREKDYNVFFWKPEWKYKKMSDWVEEFLKEINLNKKEEITVIGFSFGALIALLVSEKTKNINKLILCSLPPYFKDDIKKLPNLSHKILGSRRMLEFNSMKFSEKIHAKIILLVGENELPLTIRRSKKMCKKISAPEKELVLIPDVEHNISDINYTKEVEKYL